MAPLRGGAQAQAAAPLRVGLLPSIATLSLLRIYDPLRDHLQDALGRPVELYTAASYRAHIDAVDDGDFDMIVTGPQFGVLAYDLGYLPLYRYNQELTPVIIVPKGTPLRSPEQLRGKRILTADRMAALSVVAETWLLMDYDMKAGRDYEVKEVPSYATAIQAVVIGDSDAAVSSTSVLQQVPQDLRDKVVYFTSRLRMPHQMYLVHPRVGEATIRVLREALGSVGETERGKAFFKSGGFKGLVPLTAADIEQARPYAEVVRNMIRSGN